MPSLTENRRRRLHEHEEPSLLPLIRAEGTLDCSIYWCGAREFPLDSYERTWLLEFLLRLAAHLKQACEDLFLNTRKEIHNQLRFSVSTANPTVKLVFSPQGASYV